MDSEAVDRDIASEDLRTTREALSIRGTSGTSTRQTMFVAGALLRAQGSFRCSSRGHLLALSAIALLAAQACEKPPAAAPAPERILLVSIDTLRADHVGSYGAERASTRNLDALAASGVRFDAAVSPAPLTLPSHTSLMTALDPPGHGVRHNEVFRLPDAVPTLAEHLKQAGYATAAVVGSLVLDRRYGLARGFDFYDDRMGERVAGGAGWPERRADQVVDAAIARLASLGPRFFLWVHFYDPHLAYDPPPGFASAFPTRPYAGEVAFVDAQLGRLLQALRERYGDSGLLVVATSDHGESFGEHGEETHSYFLYETTQRIPLVFAGPGIPAGRSVAAPVGLVDVAPTVLALAHAEPIPGAAGRDLQPLFAGESAAPANAYFETLATQLDFGWSPLLGLRQGNFKYIRAPRPELYDLVADPAELHSLALERPDLAASLDAALTKRLQASPQGTATPLAVTPAEREQLASLGYLAPDGSASLLPLGQVGGHDPKDQVAVLAEIRGAQALMAQGKAGEALARLRAIGEAGPGVAALRAAAAVNAGEPEAAERDARRVLAASPDRSDVRIVLALALDAQGRSPEALAVLRELPGDVPLDAGLALRLAAAEAEAGELDTALRRLALAVEHHPRDPDLARSHGQRLAGAGRPEAALAAFEAALALESDSSVLQNDVARALALQRGDLDRALALAVRAAAASENAPSVLDTLAIVRLARGEAGEALAVAERALRTAPPGLRPHLEYLRAEAFFALARPLEARQALALARASAAADEAEWRAGAEALDARLARPSTKPASPPVE